VAALDLGKQLRETRPASHALPQIDDFEAYERLVNAAERLDQPGVPAGTARGRGRVPMRGNDGSRAR